MVVLGGWLFADLLLGLAMLFAVANTVGAPPPEPTPTPLPNYEATAEADIALQQASSEQTVEALQGQIGDAEAAAQATENAQATREAMTAQEQSTADAQATQDAVVAQATIEALSTEQASNELNQADLNNELATTVAQATEVAAQIEAQGTEQAQLQAQATENAESGVNTQGTQAALEENLARSQNVQATNEANLTSAQGTLAALEGDLASSQSVQATNEANLSSAQQQATDAEATAAAAQSALAEAEQQIQLNTLDANAITETVEVDLNGVIGGDDDAVDEAVQEMDAALAPYVQGESCRIGFVLISSRAPDIGQGIQLSNAIAQLIEQELPQLLPEPVEGEDLQLASESIALPGTQPTGEVQLLLFLSSGCQPAE